MAGQVDPDDAVRFGELFGLLPPELAGGRKAVDENQWKPLTGDAYERVAYRHVSRRHHSCYCCHSCARSGWIDGGNATGLLVDAIDLILLALSRRCRALPILAEFLHGNRIHRRWTARGHLCRPAQ